MYITLILIQIYFSQYSAFPYQIPGCLENFSVFLLGYLSPDFTLCKLPLCRDALHLNLMETILENHPALLDPSSLQDSILRHCTNETLKETKVFFHEVQGSVYKMFLI